MLQSAAINSYSYTDNLCPMAEVHNTKNFKMPNMWCFLGIMSPISVNRSQIRDIGIILIKKTSAETLFNRNSREFA